MGIGWPEVSHISILGCILPPMKWGSLWPRTGRYGICTDYGHAFLKSQCPSLPFYITIPLMQMRYHGDWLARSFAYFHSRPFTAPHETGYFVAPHL